MKVNPDQDEFGRNRAPESMVARPVTHRGEEKMDSGEKDYFLERAEAELDLANQANHENAARAHYYLAGFYLDRAYGGTANEN
jgi:hypothetical protein